MALSNSRGRACKCKECPWVGERCAAAEHFVKKHCSFVDAPFGCETCRFKTITEKKLEQHFKGEQHARKSKKSLRSNQQQTSRGKEVDLERYFSILSTEESAKLWEARKVRVGKPEKNTTSENETGKKRPVTRPDDIEDITPPTKKQAREETSPTPEPLNQEVKDHDKDNRLDKEEQPKKPTKTPERDILISTDSNSSRDESPPRPKRQMTRIKRHSLSSSSSSSSPSSSSDEEETKKATKRKTPEKRVDQPKTPEKRVAQRQTPEKRVDQRQTPERQADQQQTPERRIILTDRPIDLTTTARKKTDSEERPPVADNLDLTVPKLEPPAAFHQTPTQTCEILTGVTRQLVTLTQSMNQVATRIETATAAQKAKPTDLQRPNRFDISANHVMGDVRAELKVLNGTCSQLVKAVMEKNRNDQEHHRWQKGQYAQMSSMLNGLMTCINSFGHTMTDFSTKFESTIDNNHQMTNFETEWKDAQQDSRVTRPQDNRPTRPTRPENQPRHPYTYSNHYKNLKK